MENAKKYKEPPSAVAQCHEVNEAAQDSLAAKVEDYHGGWCVIAARRDLVRKKETDIVSLTSAFGKYVVSSLPPKLENFDQIRNSVGEVAEEQDKFHTFVVTQTASAFFHQLHIKAQEIFPTLLKTSKSRASKRMKDHLQEDTSVLSAFHAVVTEHPCATEENCKSLLEGILAKFVKSKQKQLLSEYGMAPAKSSLALQSSISKAQQPKPKDQSQEQQPQKTANMTKIRHSIEQGRCEEAIQLLLELEETKRNRILKGLTMLHLKALLRSLDIPVARNLHKGELLSKLESGMTARQSDVEANTSGVSSTVKGEIYCDATLLRLVLACALI